MLRSSFEIEKLKVFDDHRRVIFLEDKSCGLVGFIAIHRGGNIQPAFGATRLWRYRSSLEALIDSLRLSRLMSYKSALAGLKYGGAKGVLIQPKSCERGALLKAYAQKVNSLGGKFVTGADVGLDDKDVEVLASYSDYIVGTKSDPVRFTCLGVLFSIQSCLQQIFGKNNLDRRTFAIQGVGKTGIGILGMIYPHAKKIYVSDIDSTKLTSVKQKFPKVKTISPYDIYNQAVDVFCPCALSNAINRKFIPLLRCAIVVGSANNQLEEDSLGETLRKADILFAPDYIVNSGGLISVVDEFEHKNFDEKRVEERVQHIPKTLRAIFEKSKRSREATNLVANKMAEKIFNKFT